MGKPKDPKPAKLFMSLMAGEEEILQRGLVDLRSAFGEIDFMSERFSFNFTDYYTKEMGPNLFRYLITFQSLISPSSLAEIKHTTNWIEEKYSAPNGNRRINIDPGYLCLEHVILATTKGYTHRPYLRDGIYADLTLIYRSKSFQTLEWTYPDYRQPQIVELFNRWRARYAEALKGRQEPQC